MSNNSTFRKAAALLMSLLATGATMAFAFVALWHDARGGGAAAPRPYVALAQAEGATTFPHPSGRSEPAMAINPSLAVYF